MRMRRAEDGDADTVRRISAAAYVPAYEAVIGAVPKPAYEDYAPRIAKGEVWILEADGVAAGVAVIEARADHVLVYSIAVRPEDQGKGYGTVLLRFAESRARELGVPQVRLYTNRKMEKNLALYRRCGFAETGMRPHPSRPGEVLVDLAKRLDGAPAA